MDALTQTLVALLATELPPLPPLPASEFVIYGAGHIGREVAHALRASGRGVRAFLDARATGAIDGVPILSPATEDARRLADARLPVVVAIFNPLVDPWPIHQLLAGLGFARIIGFGELQESFALPPHFWLTHRRHPLEHRARLLQAWELFADEESRRIFLETIQLRLTLDPQLMRAPSLHDQYLPTSLPRPRQPLRFIDGGAFDGDTLRGLRQHGLTFAAVAAFEPDPANFRSLCAAVQQHTGSLGDTTLWPCGVAARTGLATFRHGQGTGSAVGADGDAHIQLVALDDVLPSFAPNYIKFDIEGSELAALQGAAETIRKSQAYLAVCVYHCPDHLWEIPLQIRTLLPDHRIALRYHAWQAFELVAYAFPPD